ADLVRGVATIEAERDRHRARFPRRLVYAAPRADHRVLGPVVGRVLIRPGRTPVGYGQEWDVVGNWIEVREIGNRRVAHWGIRRAPDPKLAHEGVATGRREIDHGHR